MKLKAMKFKITSPEHSKKVQEKLIEMGYAWGGKNNVPQNLYDPAIYAGYFGENEITYCHTLEGFEDLGDFDCQEHFLNDRGEFVTADYWKAPSTKVSEQFPCEGCRPGDCAGCGEAAPETKYLLPKTNEEIAKDLAYVKEHFLDVAAEDKTFVPLPIATRKEHNKQRMISLAENITHAIAFNGDDEDISDWLDELLYLHGMKEHF